MPSMAEARRMSDRELHLAIYSHLLAVHEKVRHMSARVDEYYGVLVATRSMVEEARQIAENALENSESAKRRATRALEAIKKRHPPDADDESLEISSSWHIPPNLAVKLHEGERAQEQLRKRDSFVSWAKRKSIGAVIATVVPIVVAVLVWLLAAFVHGKSINPFNGGTP
jgi:hypothetical protein